MNQVDINGGKDKIGIIHRIEAYINIRLITENGCSQVEYDDSNLYSFFLNESAI